ncbi:MAG TPA: type I phosphomannose isomerase catalytic subunit [Candidatus Acidoferrales bacterium]|nr:type I phosphomannose isomerase catalytic subunit [Candidatus Acidoferrales bacterium]
MKPCPARLEPIFSLRPWGARSLAPLFPEKSNLPEPIGEAWLTGLECKFATGPFAGNTLGEAWCAMDASWRGASIEPEANFPLLVKFLFTREKLSVQVHPDDDYASRYEAKAGGRGKTEMWYALHAEPGADVLLGLKPEVTREKFKRAIEDGTAENLLQRVAVRTGDVIFVPAKTAHTIGAGLTICEIQEYSDLTYRVYDYNRRDAKGNARELHIEKALEVLRFGEQHGGKTEPVRIERNGVTETYLAACPYFATEKWEFDRPVAAASSHERFEMLVILDGNGRIQWEEAAAEYSRAQLWIIPAALGAYRIAPQSRTSLLRIYEPADMEEFVRRLEERGVDRSRWSKLIYT